MINIATKEELKRAGSWKRNNKHIHAATVTHCYCIADTDTVLYQPKAVLLLLSNITTPQGVAHLPAPHAGNDRTLLESNSPDPNLFF